MSGARGVFAVLLLAAAAPALAAKKPLGSSERIDVSHASVAELMRLPQVGRKKAEAIVAHRTRSPLHRLEDLLSVKGVSPGWLEKQRAHLSVGTAPAPRPATPPRSTAAAAR